MERNWLPTALVFRHPDGRGIDLHPVGPTPMAAVTRSSLTAPDDGITRPRWLASSMAFPSAAARLDVRSQPIWDTNPTPRTAPIWRNSRETYRSNFRLPIRPDDRPSAGDPFVPLPAAAIPRRSVRTQWDKGWLTPELGRRRTGPVPPFDEEFPATK